MVFLFMKIQLLGIKTYSEVLGVSRQTLWHWAKNDSIDYYVLPKSKRKWFALEESQSKRRILDLGPTIL